MIVENDNYVLHLTLNHNQIMLSANCLMLQQLKKSVRFTVFCSTFDCNLSF